MSKFFGWEVAKKAFAIKEGNFLLKSPFGAWTTLKASTVYRHTKLTFAKIGHQLSSTIFPVSSIHIG
jgi:hypothetical protein